MAFQEDISDFFDTEEHGDLAVYTPRGLSPVADVQVIIDADVQGIDERGISGNQVIITLHNRTLYRGAGDTVRVGTRVYEIHQKIDDDGTVQQLLATVDWDG